MDGLGDGHVPASPLWVLPEAGPPEEKREGGVGKLDRTLVTRVVRMLVTKVGAQE